MSLGVLRALVAAACLAGLAACESSTKTSSPFRPAGSPETTASTAEPATPDAAPATPGPTASAADVTGSGYAAPPPRPRELCPPGPAPWPAGQDPHARPSPGNRPF